MNSRPRRRAKTAPAVEILVKSALWSNERGITMVLRRAIGEAASLTGTAGELAVVLTDDRAIRALNRVWRRMDQPTNVLSFPALPEREAASSDPRRAAKGQNRRVPRHLGDIVIAYQTAAREAKAEHKPFAHHVAHLAVHGFLHLLGYDHDVDPTAATMEGLEVAVLARIRVPNPYAAHHPMG